MHHPTDRITHTTTFDTPVVEHWLERKRRYEMHIRCVCVCRICLAKQYQTQRLIILTILASLTRTMIKPRTFMFSFVHAKLKIMSCVSYCCNMYAFNRAFQRIQLHIKHNFWFRIYVCECVAG